jgi:O-antigen/teichoic acid export membrane protein
MLVFGVSGAIKNLIGFLLIPLYTYYIGPRELGVWAILMIIFQAVPLVLRMGLGNALLRSWYDYEDDQRPPLASTVFIFLMLTSIPLLLVMAGFSTRISNWQFSTANYAPHLRIICLLSLLEIFNVVPDTLMKIRNASLQYSACQMIGFITQLSITLTTVLYLERGIEGILLGYLAGSSIQYLLMFFLTFRGLRWGFDTDELKKMLAFGTPLIFGRLAAISFQSIDRIFLKHYVNMRIVGLYAFGNQLTSPINMLVTTPFSMIWPNMQFSTMKDRDANEYYARMLTYMVLLAAIFALPLAILVEDLLHIIASPKYWETAAVVPWLALASVLDITNPVLSVGVSLKRKSFLSPIIVITSALINIGLNFLLIPTYGMKGAAIATVLSYIAMCVIRYQISNRLVPVTYEWGRLFKIGAVGLMLFMLSRLIDIESPIASFCARLPFAVLLPFILIPMGFFDAQEKRKFSELMEKAGKLLRREI